ncbi:MAG TPA: cupredoxin domain-containing protein [Anaerolineales bacterium]|nr:cupredoxin domain-containing protein [Anaerolineales bacterium]
MKRKYLFAAMLLSLLLAGCGGAAAVSDTINVTMTDFQFQPNQFIVPAGQEITFNSSNNGAVIHNFVVMQLGTTAGDTFDDEDVPNVYWEAEIPPGGSVNTSFTAPSEPGEYQVVCRTEGHIISGMIATLTVVAAEE